MSKILYGAGAFAESYIELWIQKGLLPVCFVDSDASKHYKLFPYNQSCESATSLNNTYGERKIQFEILPLNVADERYPNAEWFISVLYDAYQIYEILSDFGIPKERIFYLNYDGIVVPHNYENVGSQWCSLLNSQILIDGPGIISCDELQAFKVPRTTNFNLDLEKYMQRRASIFEALQSGKYCTCSGCYYLKSGIKEMPSHIKIMDIGTGVTGTKCNYNCCYCNYDKSPQKEEDGKETVLDILKIIAENYCVDQMFYSGGEIAFSPFRDEILDLYKAKKWRGCIFTNSSMHIEKLADLMTEKQVMIIVSIDAGTKKTYSLIKGVDCYDKVLDNLRKYASTGGDVRCKYIILEGYNDNEIDNENFVKFAKEINASIEITVDFRVRGRMSESVYNTMVRLVRLCDEQIVNYRIRTSFMSPEDYPRLKADGVNLL